MKSELTPRQWALYNYLKEKGDQWTTQFNVALDLQEYWIAEIPASGFHDSPVRLAMTNDIRAINESSVIQKVILSTCKGVKLANEEEFDRYIRKEIMSAVRRLMRAKYKAKKGSRDGQMRFVLGGERDTIKAFIDSDKATGERLKQARIKSGWTAKKVVANLQACGIKIDEPLLSRYEHGYACPTKSQLKRLCEIYEVTPEYITGEEVIRIETE